MSLPNGFMELLSEYTETREIFEDVKYIIDKISLISSSIKLKLLDEEYKQLLNTLSVSTNYTLNLIKRLRERNCDIYLFLNVISIFNLCNSSLGSYTFLIENNKDELNSVFHTFHSAESINFLIEKLSTIKDNLEPIYWSYKTYKNG